MQICKYVVSWYVSILICKYVIPDMYVVLSSCQFTVLVLICSCSPLVFSWSNYQFYNLFSLVNFHSLSALPCFYLPHTICHLLSLASIVLIFFSPLLCLPVHFPVSFPCIYIHIYSSFWHQTLSPIFITISIFSFYLPLVILQCFPSFILLSFVVFCLLYLLFSCLFLITVLLCLFLLS